MGGVEGELSDKVLPQREVRDDETHHERREVLFDHGE